MKLKKALALILCTAVLFTAWCSTASNESRADADGVSAETKYEFVLVYDSENHQLTGTMKATITNRSGDPWEKIVINDWATTPYYQTSAYPNYAPTDFIDPTVTFGDEVIPVTMQRQSNLSSLDVDAGIVIPDGGTVVFETGFVIHIPNVSSRYGYSTENGIEQVALGNALPVLGLYKDGEWVTHIYVPDGESFNSEVADYDVTFTCPPEYTAVMTGIPEVTGSTYRCVENNVRDFAIMLATHHTAYTEDHNGLRITIWGNSDLSADFKMLAGQAESIFDFYTELIGPYPYDSIDVCLFDLPAGGMEYPELVIINTDEAFDGPQALAHELGHEWFYLAVGNDEFTEPWIDESITSYISILYMESLGYDMTDSYVHEWYKTYYDICCTVGVQADDDYYLLSVYIYGPTFLRDINELMGDDAFIAALRDIYGTYFLKQADTEGILDIFRGHAQVSIEDLIERYFTRS